MSTQIERRWFSVDEYYRMIDAGILSEDDRVELIDGEVFEMSPIVKDHAACVKRTNELFGRVVRRRAIVSVQDPVRLSDFSEPQPDIALLKRRPDFYRSGHPTPAEVLLIVEVGDATIEYDRRVKVPLYARSGIPEVWLVDLVGDLIEIYGQLVNGRYQSFREARRGDALTLGALPKFVVAAEEILG
ncbi:MAG TPA: Uma2 family endonuclease [Blastocatellia bacterium]|nr:Uma2 family endonuclease [Blastocatellia bacterium]